MISRIFLHKYQRMNCHQELRRSLYYTVLVPLWVLYPRFPYNSVAPQMLKTQQLAHTISEIWGTFSQGGILVHVWLCRKQSIHGNHNWSSINNIKLWFLYPLHKQKITGEETQSDASGACGERSFKNISQLESCYSQWEQSIFYLTNSVVVDKMVLSPTIL